MSKWTYADIPDQSGRTVLITGANSGLGLQSAKVLAGKGARVLLAARSAERGEQALRSVEAVAETKPALIGLDLADLRSVRNAAAEVRESTGDRLDVLINNGGVMATPLGRTADGFELQLGTNYLGHAALTWLLMPALRGGDGARVVTLTSVAAIGGRIDLHDPNYEHRHYNPGAAYAQSKIANQTFAMELDRRLRAAGEDVVSVAAAPGYVGTNLFPNMVAAYSNPLARAALSGVLKLGAALLSQSVQNGALSQVYAATAPGVRGGVYLAPARIQMWGRPSTVRPLAPARDHAAGAGLWALTAKLTGVTPDPA
ncbi:oxidoreductase [Amycolatopsis sp. GM8]|uniref:oxidoreductase n=1 Tax=Amycolatopsis sp. GM8 TaxID=2896530 RepID=UPI001F0232A2|nr:oxidoreductase [Amycolatopsis sp. GM8]